MTLLRARGLRAALSLSIAASAAASTSAQQTFLSEDFSGGVPPSGWTELLQGAGPGWEDAAGAAFHDDFGGSNDSLLVTPALDLASAADPWLHFRQSVTFSAWRGATTVEVSTDGGTTWTVAWSDAGGDVVDAPVAVDLGAWAGSTGVRLAFRYVGSFGSEWTVDDVVAWDSAQAPPPPTRPWTVNLPATHAAAPFTEDFDGLGGTVPAYLAVTAVDALTGAPDPEAWCNVGQMGPCAGGASGLGAASGAYCLEMGLDPASSNFHEVRNALVVGLDGSGVGDLMLDLSFVQFDDEYDDFDGIWVSENGLDWVRVQRWDGLVEDAWTPLQGVELSTSGVSTDGPFFLMFAQQDNYPYGNIDGIGVDDLDVGFAGAAGGATLTVTNLVGGETAHFAVTGARFHSTVSVAYSLTGSGPTSTPYGDVDLSPPILPLGAPIVVDALGEGGMDLAVPAGGSGLTVRMQAVEFRSDGSTVLTNSLALVVG